MFSQRFQFSLENNRWAQAMAQAREAQRGLIDLAISNPTGAGFSWDTGTLAGTLASERISSYKPHARGDAPARRAIADFYLKTHGARVSEENIHLTASTSEAYAWIFKLLCNSGDNVAIPAPSYPLIAFLCRMESVSTREYKLQYQRDTRDFPRWEVDFESLEKAIDEKTRAIVCVNPNNPTGSIFSEKERARLLAIARERNLPLVVDEVFLEYPKNDFPAGTPFAGTFAGTLDVPVFVLGGLSKTAALPQIKVGWILTCGNADFCASALARLDFIADTFLSVNTPAQCAVPAILQNVPVIRERIAARLQANENALRAWCARSLHDLKLLNREAGWYGIVRLPRGVDEESLVLDLLRRESVIVHPGYFYDVENVPAPHLVFSLLAPETSFGQAFPRIESALLRN